MSARFIVADVFDGLAQLEDGSVDLVITSPPFLALRSYLPADHPDKGKEIGSEPTPAEFVDTLLAVTAELRRVLAPHGSIAVELGDTYAGSGGAGGDYGSEGLREGQPKFRQVGSREHRPEREGTGADGGDRLVPFNAGPGWPLAKSKTLIPELYRLALAYGINPLTGAESPAGRWRVRNVVTWCRPNPPVGALGDKWRPATSDVVVAAVSDKRYWDDIATRREHQHGRDQRPVQVTTNHGGNKESRNDHGEQFYSAGNSHGAPLLDYWEIPPGGYPGSHYAVFPPALVEPLIKAMAPPKVCRECGEPSRRIVENGGLVNDKGRMVAPKQVAYTPGHPRGNEGPPPPGHVRTVWETTGWTDCGCPCPADETSDGRPCSLDCTIRWRPAIVLDPFAGSGTTLAVATGHGHDAIGIDLDERNRDLAYDRIGGLLWDHS